jgi:hypothetical protein
MRNSTAFYIDLGTKAARACNQDDEIRENAHRQRFVQAIELEEGLDRKQAELVFQETFAAFSRKPVLR